MWLARSRYVRVREDLRFASAAIKVDEHANLQYCSEGSQHENAPRANRARCSRATPHRRAFLHLHRHEGRRLKCQHEAKVPPKPDYSRGLLGLTGNFSAIMDEDRGQRWCRLTRMLGLSLGCGDAQCDGLRSTLAGVWTGMAALLRRRVCNGTG